MKKFSAAHLQLFGLILALVLILTFVPQGISQAQSIEQQELTNYFGATTTGTTTRVSVHSTGVQGDNDSLDPSISADGRYVVYTSSASNLVSNDTNGVMDVFVYDRQIGETTRVSVSSAGVQGNNDSLDPSISADGRYVVYISRASNLVSNDTNGVMDVFVYDRQIGETTRVSVSSAGVQGEDFDCYESSISADGRYVAFSSGAYNLVINDNDGNEDIFVHDRQNRETTLISVSSAGLKGNGGSRFPSISADGQFVAFMSFASNLVSGDTNNTTDIFIHDRQSGETTLISVSSAGVQGNGTSWYPSISGDGRYVAFSSGATNLDSGDTNDLLDVFVHDRQSKVTTWISHSNSGAQGNDYSYPSSISADGQFVAFRSFASNLVSGDTNNEVDIFIHDRQNGETTLVSISSAGVQGNDESTSLSINANGRYVAFSSRATNLISGDTNSYGDVFVHDRVDAGYSINGLITDLYLLPIHDVTINLNNPAGDLVSSVTSNSDGSYLFSNIPTGSYTLTPLKNGESFTPESRSVTLPPNASGQNFSANPITKPWLLMYYLAGDNDLSKDISGFIQTLENAGNENVNIAIFIDGSDSTAQYISVNSESINAVQKNELNTGDPQTLIDFIMWAKINYPADHTALVLFDHGHALSGVALDDSSGINWLTPPELKQAFSSAGGVDVLHMFTCLMANLEAQYQLRGFVDYYIGSENQGWGENHFGSYLSKVTSTTSPEQLAIEIADSYFFAVEPTKVEPSNISVVDMSKIDNVAAKTSVLADVIRANWLTTSFFVWGITDSSSLQRFDSSGDYVIDNYDVLADLYDFAWQVKGEPKFVSAANDVMAAVNEYVIYNKTWSGSFEVNGVPHQYYLNDSHGVSIGLPRSRISFYSPTWLDFAEGADWVISPWSVEGIQINTTGLNWGAFVSDLVKEYNPTAPDSPNPPDLVSPLTIDTPIITNIYPSRVLAGSSDLMLTVNGVGFMTDSVINWNGVSRPTTYIDGTKLTAQIYEADSALVGSALVTVTTPGGEDGTSNEYEFVITDHLPDSDEKMTTSKVTFSWVPIENAIKYKLQLSTKPDFSVLLLNVKTTDPTYFFDSILQFNKTYYWRVRPFYADSKGDWLPTWNFTSMDALAKSTLTYPDHKQTLTTPDVTLVWEMVENATQYKVVIAKDALFQNKVTSLKTANASATFALPDGKYFWRVRALDLYGAKGPWSDYRKFTVDAE